MTCIPFIAGSNPVTADQRDERLANQSNNIARLSAALVKLMASNEALAKLATDRAERIVELTAQIDDITDNAVPASDYEEVVAERDTLHDDVLELEDRIADLLLVGPFDRGGWWTVLAFVSRIAYQRKCLEDRTGADHWNFAARSFEVSR